AFQRTKRYPCYKELGSRDTQMEAQLPNGCVTLKSHSSLLIRASLSVGWAQKPHNSQELHASHQEHTKNSHDTTFPATGA
ncbi:hypothetical protein ACQP3J_31095, partial [Escherichia coli]